MSFEFEFLFKRSVDLNDLLNLCPGWYLIVHAKWRHGQCLLLMCIFDLTLQDVELIVTTE